MKNQNIIKHDHLVPISAMISEHDQSRARDGASTAGGRVNQQCALATVAVRAGGGWLSMGERRGRHLLGQQASRQAGLQGWSEQCTSRTPPLLQHGGGGSHQSHLQLQ